MKHIKTIIMAFIFVAFLAAPALALASPQTTFAAANANGCEKDFLGISPWFRGLSKVVNGQCTVVSPGVAPDGGKALNLQAYILRIALNVVDIGLSIVGYIAFFFILYGGFQFLTGGDNPSQVEKARKTIFNAVIGLVISLGAVAIINLVFGILG